MLIHRPLSWGITTPPIGAQIQYGNPMASGLISAWLMNENGGANFRSSIDQSLATAIGSPTWSRGQVAFVQGISHAASAKVVTLGSGPFSVFCLFTFGSGGSYSRILETLYTDGFYLGLNSAANAYSFIVREVAAVGASGGTLTANKRYALLGTFDGTNVRLYVDGILAGGPYAPTLASAVDRVLYFARYSLASSNGITGNIGPVYIWNRQLSGSEAELLAFSPYALVTPPSPTIRIFQPSVAVAFQPAWAGSSNQVISGGYSH